MLTFGIFTLIAAGIAAVLGFGGFAAGAVVIAKFSFIGFLVLSTFSIALHFLGFTFKSVLKLIGLG